MAGLREFLRKNPLVGWALVVLVVALAGYVAAGRLVSRAPASVATPTPQTAPVPQVTAQAQPVVPEVKAPNVVPSGPVGRTDPFVPLVKAPVGGGTPTPPPPPPSVALPPPPFPGPGTPPPPLPPAPGTAQPPTASPPSPPAPGAGIAVTGIVGDGKAVAIVAIGGKTEIVAAGETIGDLRVIKIDSLRRVVTFSRAGKLFDVRMGGD